MNTEEHVSDNEPQTERVVDSFERIASSELGLDELDDKVAEIASCYTRALIREMTSELETLEEDMTSELETLEEELRPGADSRLVIPEHIETKETDDRGRLTLGSDHGNRRVTVAVVESAPIDG